MFPLETGEGEKEKTIYDFNVIEKCLNFLFCHVSNLVFKHFLVHTFATATPTEDHTDIPVEPRVGYFQW